MNRSIYDSASVTSVSSLRSKIPTLSEVGEVVKDTGKIVTNHIPIHYTPGDAFRDVVDLFRWKK